MSENTRNLVEIPIAQQVILLEVIVPVHCLIRHRVLRAGIFAVTNTCDTKY